MLNIAIVENEVSAADTLRSYLDKYSKAHGDSFNIIVFEDAVKFLSKYNVNFDIVFMDIDMPDLDGMSAAKQLREIDDKVILIFVTNLSHYAIKGYEVDAMDYIVKPVIYPAFALKLKKAVYRCKKMESKEVFVTTNNGEIRFAASSIIFVEITGHHIEYHTERGDYSAYGTMSNVENILPKTEFFKCNSCYLVNLRYVTGINGFIANVGGHKLSISHRRKKEFLKTLRQYYKEGGDFVK